MKYLDFTDIRELLGLNDRQAKAFLRSEEVPSIKVGRKYLIEEDKLTKYLEDNDKTVLNY